MKKSNFFFWWAIWDSNPEKTAFETAAYAIPPIAQIAFRVSLTSLGSVTFSYIFHCVFPLVDKQKMLSKRQTKGFNPKFLTPNSPHGFYFQG